MGPTRCGRARVEDLERLLADRIAAAGIEVWAALLSLDDRLQGLARSADRRLAFQDGLAVQQDCRMRVAVICDVHGNLPALEAVLAAIGSPRARFAVVDDRSGRWEASFHAVAYDWESAAVLAEGFGRPDVAFALRTGRVA